ncbi:hypothetical protein ACMS1Z_14160 [Acidiphilium multivorum]|uniref:hypothetical protein n=1 Tax=Acidiphilium multivorum TaxID=62140 RepID=UPI0039C95516
MPSEAPSPAPWNTPESNPLYPLPIQPLDPDDPWLKMEDPKRAGTYCLDMGVKPVRTRKEL